MRRTRARGTSLVEVLIAASISTLVMGGAVAVLRSTSDLARGTTSEEAVSYRVTQTLDAAAEEIRRCSLGSVKRLDGTTFVTGATDAGFTSRRVLNYSGTPTLAAPVTIRLDLPAGASAGEVVNASGPVVQTLARGVTQMQVTRNGGAFTITVAARSGTGSSLRTASGSVTVRTRNP